MRSSNPSPTCQVSLRVRPIAQQQEQYAEIIGAEHDHVSVR